MKQCTFNKFKIIILFFFAIFYEEVQSAAKFDFNILGRIVRWGK